MRERFIFLVDRNQHYGYTVATLAMAERVPFPVIFDEQNTKKDLACFDYPATVLIGVGDTGFELLKKYGSGQKMFWATDRFNGENLNELNTSELTVIAPLPVIKLYKEATTEEKIKIRYEVAVFPATFRSDVQRKHVEDFLIYNDDNVVNPLFDYRPEYFFFFGGRVQERGKWVENSTELFERTAEKLMADSHQRNMVVVFHPLRSHTHGDNSDDFAPQTAAIQKIRSLRHKWQKVIVLANTADGQKMFVFGAGEDKVFNVLNSKDIAQREHFKTLNIDVPSCAYYAALRFASRSNARVVFTSEQTTLIPEAVKSGVDWQKIHPFGKVDGWNLTSDSLEKQNKAYFEELRLGHPMTSQADVFKRLIMP